MPGNVLVLRTISTTFNYDYINDYLFYPNGVIQAHVSASGYVQAIFWTSHESPYATAANSASFYLRPYNFFDENPSMASRDAVLISPAKNGKFDINRFGTPEGPARAAKDKPQEHKGVP